MADSSNKGDILKVRLGDDVRRMVLYNTHISYDDLVLMLQRVYGGKLKSSDDVALKYYDEDNDLITIADDSDFAHAREYAPRGVVKMVVYVNGQDRCVDTKKLLGIRRELVDVRNKVNSLVDVLDSAKMTDDQPSTTTARDVLAQENNTGWAKKEELKIPPQAASMFDPLANSSSIQTSTVTTTLNTITGTVSSTHVETSSGIAGQSAGGASQLFGRGGSNQDSSSVFLQPVNQQPLSQSQSGSYYSQPQTSSTTASAPPPSSTPQPPPSSSSYPAAQTGQPSYPPQQQTGYPSSYAAQPSAPSAAATAPVSNPSSYPPGSAPDPSQYVNPASAPNPVGFTQGSYQQPIPGTAPYPGSYGGSNVGAYPSQGSPYPQQPGASARYPGQQYGRPYKIGY